MVDLFGMELALGTVKNLESDTSQALAQAVTEAQAYVQAQDHVYVDETGWPQENRSGWLWVAVTVWVTVFIIRFSRGQAVLKTLLGQTFPGIVHSDRWSAYNALPVGHRQLCWAHLIRNFQAFVDRGGPSAVIGRALVTETELMFAWWHKLHLGQISRDLFQEIMIPIQYEIVRLLDEGTRCEQPKTAHTCARIFAFEPALWTFLKQDGVEPTNNAAERAIRPAVIWRKTSLGSQSEAGSRFVERMLTVATSLKQQDRHCLAYLTQACSNRLSGLPAPSLLPPFSL
jgi:transposase